MGCKNATHHDAHTSDEIDPSVLSRRQLVQMGIYLSRRLGKQRAKADHEKELVAIHHDTEEREREVKM